eukprot:gnl/MRDRNA2_/MRDRNA2_325036_c0_seq1.p1 gnl/MRDRNA2_/MRDRNA2_325036_c0~~gnl/MRDRNA2_/MRDRNA2_325036_c0_seq1.p1  ORF type:complete len:107 (+),score=7.97 gnl/MRDRNA2_/MRDRNA2_325036_c0_seq1:51-323(+)
MDVPGYDSTTAHALGKMHSCLHSMERVALDHHEISRGPVESLLPGGVRRFDNCGIHNGAFAGTITPMNSCQVPQVSETCGSPSLAHVHTH